MRADNSAHLHAAAARRREQTLQRARDALRQLEAAGGPVTFDLVARTAGVSRAWLYTEPTIRDAVQRLRAAHRPTTNSVIPASQHPSAPATRACCAGWRSRTPATASSPPRSASSASSSPAPMASSGQPGSRLLDPPRDRRSSRPGSAAPPKVLRQGRRRPSRCTPAPDDGQQLTAACAGASSWLSVTRCERAPSWFAPTPSSSTILPPATPTIARPTAPESDCSWTRSWPRTTERRRPRSGRGPTGAPHSLRHRHVVNTNSLAGGTSGR